MPKKVKIQANMQKTVQKSRNKYKYHNGCLKLQRLFGISVETQGLTSQNFADKCEKWWWLLTSDLLLATNCGEKKGVERGPGL